MTYSLRRLGRKVEETKKIKLEPENKEQTSGNTLL
jgi:hypothetical protein